MYTVEFKCCKDYAIIYVQLFIQNILLVILFTFLFQTSECYLIYWVNMNKIYINSAYINEEISPYPLINLYIYYQNLYAILN